MHPVRQRKHSPVQHGSNTAWQPGVHQRTSHPSICRWVRTLNSGWNVAPRQPHGWLLWKSPIVPAETQEELAHRILTQHQRLHLAEKNDHQVTPSGPPSPKGLRPGIQDLATICPNSPFLQLKFPWWPDLPGCPPLDNETISPSKSTFGFHWCDWKWKFSNEKEHS